MADSDWKERGIERLLGSASVILAVAGIAFIALGIVGSVKDWMHLEESWRYISVALGVVLLVFGMRTWDREISPRLPRIKITSPTPNSEATRVDVFGTVEGTIPKGYVLRLMRVYGNERFTPVGPKRIEVKAGEWVAQDCELGGKPGEKRYFAAYLVGPSGEALLAYHNEASSTHQRTLSQLRTLSKAAVKEKSLQAATPEPEYLPAIEKRTTDMFECYRVSLQAPS